MRNIQRPDETTTKATLPEFGSVKNLSRRSLLGVCLAIGAGRVFSACASDKSTDTSGSIGNATPADTAATDTATSDTAALVTVVADTTAATAAADSAAAAPTAKAHHQAPHRACLHQPPRAQRHRC
jgi:hypothetical protein